MSAWTIGAFLRCQGGEYGLAILSRHPIARTRVLDTLPRPYVLLGDFNDEPGSRTLALFAARATEARKLAADRFTFSSGEPTKEIDFLFAAPSSAWRVGAARVIHEPMASDHRPVVTVLQRVR